MRVGQRKAYLYSRLALAATLAVGVGASGCARQQTAEAGTGRQRVARGGRTQAMPRPDAQQAALARVQAHPLYQQARQACKAKQYAQAARLLERLAKDTGLNGAESAFVQQQRALCLHDAGLPAPRVSAVPTPAPASALGARSAAASASESADCGPRALLLLCQKQGVPTDLPHLRQLAGTTKEGTSLAGLEKAATAVGLKAEGVQVSREALPDVDMPALAYVNGNHFIAVLSVQGKGEDGVATVHDPNSPREQTVSQERLLRLCSGYLLLAHR